MTDHLDFTHLTQTWWHSREEDTATTSVYRSANYSFPPARGRQGFELQPGGVAVELTPGPTDRTQRTEGTWRLKDNCLELRFSSRTVPVALQIKSIESDRLVVAKYSPSCSVPAISGP